MRRCRYTLNTSMVSQADAQLQCMCQGGHLVSYTSVEEQQVSGGRAGRPGCWGVQGWVLGWVLVHVAHAPCGAVPGWEEWLAAEGSGLLAPVH
jgi:hypothetical protein